MFYLPYIKAVKIAVVAMFFTFIALFPIHYAIANYFSQESTILKIAIGVPVFLLIQSITYHYMIIHPEYGRIGFLKSLWISFMLTVLSLPLWFSGCPTYDP
jgi:ABC-type glycerol-3-phosphate transport system permease component